MSHSRPPLERRAEPTQISKSFKIFLHKIFTFLSPPPQSIDFQREIKFDIFRKTGLTQSEIATKSQKMPKPTPQHPKFRHKNTQKKSSSAESYTQRTRRKRRRNRNYHKSKSQIKTKTPYPSPAKVNIRYLASVLVAQVIASRMV